MLRRSESGFGLPSSKKLLFDGECGFDTERDAACEFDRLLLLGGGENMEAVGFGLNSIACTLNRADAAELGVGACGPRFMGMSVRIAAGPAGGICCICCIGGMGPGAYT